MFATDQDNPPPLVQTITTLQLISDILLWGNMTGWSAEQSNIQSFTWYESFGCENAGSCEMVESTEDIRSDYSYGILSDYTDLH